MARIYLATSWRNPYHEEVMQMLRQQIVHAVYDFKFDNRLRMEQEPDYSLGSEEPPATAFSWSEMNPNYKDWTPFSYKQALQTSQRAAQGYIGDLRGMEWADTCVLRQPCGNSAHIEAGYMKGRGKRLIIYWHNNETVTKAPTGETLLVDDSRGGGKHVPEYKTWKFAPDLMYLLADNICVGIDELLRCLVHGK